jgi:hypothetical protein
MYVIYLGKECDGYYKSPSLYKYVPRNQATRFTHKEANKLEGQLRRWYKQAVMEPA